MKLPIPFFTSKKKESDYYLALILTDEKAGAVILKAEEGTIAKVNANEAFFADSIEELSLEDLISAIDKAISRAEEVLPPHVQTHQTIFGVQGNWVDSETKKIKKEYLEKLKKVCNALDLSPVGFMVTTEAIIHLLQDEEGAPVSAVFAEIGKKHVLLSLLRGGKVIESVSSPHGESAQATVDKLLGHFTVPVLPARIIIFQNKSNEHTSQAFIAHQWSKHLPFLHVPQVTVLPQTFDMRAVMYGAATQMGFKVIEKEHEVVQHEVLNSEVEEPPINEEDSEPYQSQLIDSKEQPPIDFDKASDDSISDIEAASDFGFVVDEEIAEHKPVRHEEMTEAPIHRQLYDDSLTEVEEPEFEPTRRTGRSEEESSSPLAFLSSLKLPKQLKVLNVSSLFSRFKGGKSYLKIVIPLVALILIIGGLVYFYFYKMQANVVLTMQPNMVNQDETVTFSTAESNDFSNNLIAAKPVSTSINAQVSTPATGSKDVGDKAKGTVTIYNNQSSSVTLNSGTTLTASNGKQFTLDNNETIASASGDVFSGTKPGTTDATVTAKDIGTDGNEPSGTEFSIGSDNTIAAKNDNAFSGGTKKTITVVSSSDIAKLRANLPSSVQDSAKQKLSDQASSGETVLPLISSPTLENQQFNHSVNDQASQVTLTASVVYTGMAYNNSDLDEYAKTIVKAKYPQDPTIANNNLKETVSNTSQRTNQAATATVSIQAGLLPSINKQDVISNIQNKSVSEAKNSLTNLPQVQSADITFSPPIPFLPSLFSSLPHHISVTIASQ